LLFHVWDRVATWGVAEAGTWVKADTKIIAVETDKLTVDVNAPEDGVVTEFLVEEGATIGLGAPLFKMETGGEPPADAAPKKEVRAMLSEHSRSDCDTTASFRRSCGSKVQSYQGACHIPAHPTHVSTRLPFYPHATTYPSSARPFIDSSCTCQEAPKKAAAPAPKAEAPKAEAPKAEAPKSAEAPKKAAAAPAPSAPAAAPASSGSGDGAPAVDMPGVTRVKMSKLRQTVARRLKESQETAAFLTTFNEIDMSNLVGMRNK